MASVAPSVETYTDSNALRRERRTERYAARSILHTESSLKRVRYCGRYATGDAVAVKVSGRGDARRGGFGGVQSCGSVWACPVCSEKVNAARQSELTQGLQAWQRDGGMMLFGTLTLRHNKGQALADLLDAISPAWNRTTSGSTAWKKDKAEFGIEGYVRVIETKYGRHGWHPHVHFILFLTRPIQPMEIRALRRRMFGRWEAALSDQRYLPKTYVGAYKELSVLEDVGIDLRPVEAGDGLSEYFTKTGNYSTATRAAFEVTGSHAKKLGKGGRTPFDLLRDVVELGDADALDRWHEWEKASKGRRQLTWSRGLRAVLALGVELSDQDIVDEELGGETEATIGKDAWRQVIGSRPDRVTAVLDAVEADESGAKLHQLLTRWGLSVLGGHSTKPGMRKAPTEGVIPMGAQAVKRRYG